MNFTDPIHAGVSRPAMIFGVPLVPLVVVCGTVGIVAGFLGLLWYLLLIPVVIAMSQVTRNDPQRWRLLALYLHFRVLRRNKSTLWQCASYAPVQYIRRSKK